MPHFSDSLSSIFGWVSIASWIIVYSPQIYENYSLQSGEGLSILFVVVWLLGDFCNLLGAVAGGLLPTVIILALYYTACDLLLLGQIYYYRWKQNRSLSHEHEPLLTGQCIEEHTPMKRLLIRYTACLLFVFATGVLGWWIGNVTEDEKRPSPPQGDLRWQIQVLGWTSAVLYLGARLPQISKNLKTRCEGLSPALFFFAIFGNITYALSICTKSMDPKYLFTNAGWLAGSVLTVFLDVIVLSQIFYYRYRTSELPTSNVPSQ
ncbi:putative vacuolar amino acid transporter YPQ1 [Hypsizygus marmoreus]|uniref:Vacuolar amino acid transporter YPQ1 n=1 Tax=Hypsizygus marmoreus TaxID=39966 RepID=A0A369JF43_HYPMA|nr:putative vacuolar amino acid transporter YPQ1 [Hypsizygus marmoreus]